VTFYFQKSKLVIQVRKYATTNGHNNSDLYPFSGLIAYAQGISLEYNTDRPGSDYTSFDI